MMHLTIPTAPLTAGIHHISPTISVHVYEGPAPGPTAIMQAGIHGDEVAGVHALQEMVEEGVTLRQGKLLLVPVMNPGAYRARTRVAPDGRDLNRCFPGSPDGPDLEHRLAHALLSLVKVERAALVATLHESRSRHNPKVHPSFGQTLVYGVKPVPSLLADAVDRLNRELEDPNERWKTFYFPVSTSSTEVIVDTVGCVGTCVETWMGFAEARRVAMQRRVVFHLLDAIGMMPLHGSLTA